VNKSVIKIASTGNTVLYITLLTIYFVRLEQIPNVNKTNFYYFM